MNSAERRLAAGTLRNVLAALLSAGGNGVGQPSADLRRMVGALSAAAPERVAAGDFGSDLRACFEAATAAGATFIGMDRVRAVAISITNTSGAVQRVSQTGLRFALVQMALILSQTTFTSRSDIDAALLTINAAFEPAEDYAANQRNNVVYRALVALHASVARDLTQRARPLPSIVTFDVGSRLPALALSNRLYGAGDRAVELIAENKCVHPLFMAGSGRALAV